MGCSRWPNFGHFCHQCGSRWLRLASNHLFFTGNQFFFYEFWLKICFLSLGMIQMAKYGPSPAPMVSEVVGNGCKMILTTFYYTLVLWKNALKCIPWAGDDPVLLLAVSLEAIIGRTNFFHFPLQLTSLSMRKVVKVMCQFWWILLSIWLHSEPSYGIPHKTKTGWKGVTTGNIAFSYT